MPSINVYIRADDWRALKAKGLDPALVVREGVRAEFARLAAERALEDAVPATLTGDGALRPVE